MAENKKGKFIVFFSLLFFTISKKDIYYGYGLVEWD